MYTLRYIVVVYCISLFLRGVSVNEIYYYYYYCCINLAGDEH